MSWYQKGKTNLDFTEARDSVWQWHRLSHMQVCTSHQTDNHASTPPLSFLQAGCPSCYPTNSVKALQTVSADRMQCVYARCISRRSVGQSTQPATVTQTTLRTPRTCCSMSTAAAASSARPTHSSLLSPWRLRRVPATKSSSPAVLVSVSAEP